MASYNIYEQIGDPGGFGEVFRSKSVVDGIESEESFALKILKDTSEDSTKRFKKEVRMLKSLNHPTIVKVIASNLETDKPFYVMPLYEKSLKGHLNELIGNYARIKIIFNLLFDGVEYFHNEGVCHRDLKPENILVNSDSDLVISDFGLGLRLNSETNRLTKTGYGMGTFIYMSPEQMNDSKHVDHRTDIYSIGKILYECVTGTIDFNVDLDILPQGLNYVVSKCLKSNLNDRFQNIKDVRNTFNSAINILIGGVDMNNLEDIVNQIVSTNDFKSVMKQLIDKLINIDLKTEQDGIHEMIMKIPLEAISELYNREKDLTLKIIETYVDNTTSQGWAFNYTDSIGDRCKEIFQLINNNEIKAKLLYCVGQVGFAHNRWCVIGQFEDLLKSVEDTDLAFLTINELDKLYKKNVIDLNINPSKLNPIIQKWIEC
ncbi:serine/threonine-protein kinase [Clostridium tagluense]|uniref:Protein kinase domain-containing protein n=1 Tax=Clostridium tagluense TaxID=360422 RepID=A0A401UU99_9CLOT|nr:serine/threonine-protein kinase [Clostridium tagluense]GCD13117.1 hypothetical protein Ctaglu_47400 [Clostridium tagluense]